MSQKKFHQELSEHIAKYYSDTTPKQRMLIYDEVYNLRKMLRIVHPTWKNDFDDVMYAYEMSIKSMRGAEFVENIKKQYKKTK